MDHKEMNYCWKKLVEKKEEEVLDKYKCEDSKREAHRGRGYPLEWRRVRRSKKYRIRIGERIVGHGSLPCSGNLTCSESWTGGCRLVG